MISQTGNIIGKCFAENCIQTKLDGGGSARTPPPPDPPKNIIPQESRKSWSVSRNGSGGGGSARAHRYRPSPKISQCCCDIG